MSNKNDLFDFDTVDQDTSPLQFQNFNSNNSTIPADSHSGNINSAPSSSSRSNPINMPSNLYEAGGRLTSSFDNSIKSGGIFNLDSYTCYFDHITTELVARRAWKTLVPLEDYVTQVLEDSPDLYGPIWIPAFLIFTLFLTSSFSSSVATFIAGERYSYDFTRLGAAFTLVYTYYIGLPILLWAAIKYWGGVHERSPVELISLYGYSSTVWILVAWLSLIPYTPLRVALIFLATLLSLTFLVRNLFPIITAAPNVSARLLIVVVAVLHLALSLGLWFGFIATGGGSFNKEKDSTPSVPEGDDTTAEGLVGSLARMLL